MSLPIADLEIIQGEDWTQVMTLKVKSTGTPVNLTGYTGLVQIRPAVNSTKVEAEMSTTNGQLVLGSGEHNISMTLTNSQTRPLAGGRHVYDIRLVSAGSLVSYAAGGHVTVTPTTSRP